MDIQKLTKEQAVIITGFTGILCGSFGDFHADVEKRLGRGIQTFEMGMKSFMAEVKKLYEADFIEIATVCVDQAQAVPEDFVLVPKEQFESLSKFKDLYKRAIINAKKRKNQLNWAHVASLGIGSGLAVELCKAFNIDPGATNMQMMIEAQEQIK